MLGHRLRHRPSMHHHWEDILCISGVHHTTSDLHCFIVRDLQASRADVKIAIVNYPQDLKWKQYLIVQDSPFYHEMISAGYYPDLAAPSEPRCRISRSPATSC